MNSIEKLELWGDTHHPFWMDFIRMMLGAFLLYKGLHFIQNTDELMALMKGGSGFAFFTLAVAHYVAFAHLVGGLLVAIGLLTRVAIAFQLPILVGAVFFVNLSQGVYNAELWESALVLILLVVYFIFGPGRISVDYQVNKYAK